MKVSRGHKSSLSVLIMFVSYIRIGQQLLRWANAKGHLGNHQDRSPMGISVSSMVLYSFIMHLSTVSSGCISKSFVAVARTKRNRRSRCYADDALESSGCKIDKIGIAPTGGKGRGNRSETVMSAYQDSHLDQIFLSFSFIYFLSSFFNILLYKYSIK